MKKLNIDNPFFEMMGKLGDLIIINLLFLFCSLLVVTIGAAIAAMYGVFQRMEEEREGNVARTYLRCFREKLKFCTPVWLGMLLVGTVLVFDVFRACRDERNLEDSGSRNRMPDIFMGTGVCMDISSDGKGRTSRSKSSENCL